MLYRFFEDLARRTTLWSGSTIGFLTACVIILTWVATGPVFNFSDTWQLVINTGTTIVTFLMVFLIQRAQNKESLAIQIKLNELIAAVNGASNKILNIENLSEHEIHHLMRRYKLLAEKAGKDEDPTRQHTVEEIE